ncbi:MAG: VOC family protein [Pseudomonadota bacterium]
MIFDHLVVGAQTLAEAQACVEEALGVPMQQGGQHSVFHTHNTLLGLEDALYLEAIAPDPTLPDPDRPRWYDLDRFEGPARLSNWACAIEDMETVLAGMPEGVGTPVDVARGDFRWQMVVAPQGTTPFDNLWPALIAWPSRAHPAKRLTRSGVRLKRVTLVHPRAEQLAKGLSAHLKDPRVVVENGPIGMYAEFETPHGKRTL